MKSKMGVWTVLALPLAVQAQTYTRTDTIEYHDNTALWVLGQEAKTTCVAPAECTPSGSPAGIVTTETTYDARARPTAVKSFGKLQQTLSYDSTSTVASGQLGTLKTVKDGNGNTTTFGNWKRGLPQSITYADTTTQSVEVSDDGWISSVVDENGFKTCYTYDAMGRLTRVVYPSEAVAGVCDTSTWGATAFSFEYRAIDEHGIPAGHWLRREDTGTHRTNTFYDALWRPILVHDYDGANLEGTLRTQGFTYDHDGRVTFVSYPTGTTASGTTGTWTNYDALGRVSSVSEDSELGLLTTVTSYLNDTSGPYMRVTSPLGKQTRTWYQMFDQPDYSRPIRIWRPEAAVTHITRDVFGKPTRIRRSNSGDVDGGTVMLDRSYSYNSAQELCRTTEPETGATLFGYDDAGNLSWSAAGLPASTICDAAGTSTTVIARKAARTYDTRNRLKSLSFPDGRGNTTSAYTPDGRLASTIVDNDGTNVVTTAYNYNRRRLLTLERMTWGSINWPLAYTYNALGHLSSQSYPNGQAVAYAPNALGQPTQVGPYALGVQYHPSGEIKQFTYGNGITHSMTQNARRLPARSTDSGGVLDLEYGYDKHANVGSIIDHTSGARQSRSMSYDGLDRLIQATGTSFGTASYGYNVLDNLTTLKITSGTNVRDHTYNYDSSNRLTSVANTTGGATVVGLSYDVQGNLANKNGRVFNFDYGNRLRGVNGISSYVYDAHGRRVRDYTTASKYSLYSRSGQLMYDSDMRQAKATQYVYLGGSLVARTVNIIAPATPVLTVPGFNTNGSYTATWTASVNSTGYELQESVSGGAWTTAYNGTGTSRAFNGKAAGTYGYRIRACLNSVCSTWSGTSDVAVQFAPGVAPTLSVPATAASGTYTVGWSAVNSANSYTLEESANGGAWTTAYSGPNLSQSYTGKPAGGYGYRVKACNLAGCGVYSATGNVQAVYVPAGIPTVTVPPSNTTGSYTVSWSAVSAATTYQIDERTNSGAWVQIHNAAGNNKAISGKSTGSYGYRARACNVAGCGGYSNTATAQVTLPPSGTPSITIPATSTTGSYTVAWSAVSGATSYLVEEQANGGNWAQIYNAAGGSLTVSGKGNGSYNYRAKACNSAGCAGWSGSAGITVSLPPAAPTGVVAKYIVINFSPPWQVRVMASWTAVAGATRYEAYLGATKFFDGNITSAQYVYMGSPSTLPTVMIRACNATGCSSSPPVSATPQ